jgi:hypothetical protein
VSGVQVPPELAGVVLRALLRDLAERVRADGGTPSATARAFLAELHAATACRTQAVAPDLHVADDGHDPDAPAMLDVTGMLVVSQVAAASGYSCRTLRRWAANGRVAAIRAGRTWLIDPESLREDRARDDDQRHPDLPD